MFNVNNQGNVNENGEIPFYVHQIDRMCNIWYEVLARKWRNADIRTLLVKGTLLQSLWRATWKKLVQLKMGITIPILYIYSRPLIFSVWSVEYKNPLHLCTGDIEKHIPCSAVCNRRKKGEGRCLSTKG